MSTLIDRIFRHKKASTAPEILAGWPVAPYGICDICNAGLAGSDSHQVSADEFKGIAEQGYDPFATGRANLGLAGILGLDRLTAYAGWRQMVMANTTEWGLCGECSKDVAGFVASHQF
ncbi:MAG TPA: hypothetical protein VFT31_01390 [Kribbella sp.]|nr:hypothetical protein [Kribbella sp.]